MPFVDFPAISSGLGQECGAHLGDWSLAERYAESASIIGRPASAERPVVWGNVGILAGGYVGQ